MNQTRVPSPQLRESLFSHSLGQKGLWATSAGVCWPQRRTDWCPLQSPESGLLLIHTQHGLVPAVDCTRPGSRLHTKSEAGTPTAPSHVRIRGARRGTSRVPSSHCPRDLSLARSLSLCVCGWVRVRVCVCASLSPSFFPLFREDDEQDGQGRHPRLGPTPGSQLSCLPPKQDLSSMNMSTHTHTTHQSPEPADQVF